MIRTRAYNEALSYWLNGRMPPVAPRFDDVWAAYVEIREERGDAPE